MIRADLSANLRRYMKLQNLSIPDLEKMSSVSRATISNILNEKADPSISTLEKLAKSLNIEENALFVSRPVIKSLRYRTNQNLSAREKAAQDALFYTVYDKLTLYNQLEKFSPLASFDFSVFPSTPEDAAHKLREVLGIPQNMPITNFCDQLTTLGVKQFYFNFGLSKTFGLSVNKEDGGPAIFVNTGTANVERWIFTMFHELGHIILQPYSYNGETKVEDSASKEEIDADNFAAEFLLPMDVVQEKVRGTKDFSFINKILQIKKEFSISYQFALHQYCKAYSRDYGEILPKFQSMYKNWKKHDFKDHYEPEALQKEYFSFEDANFRNCIYEALSNDEIEFDIASKLLNLNNEELQQAFSEYQIREKDFIDIPF